MRYWTPGDDAIEVVTSVISITEVAPSASEKTSNILSASGLPGCDKLWTAPVPR